jgi:AcrR family transcriptional regulator
MAGMNDQSQPRLSGRRAQAAANDARILDAAREVFVANPEAPIAAVAARAGVGISALYRRYPSKEDLLRQLCSDGLDRYVAEAEAALAQSGDGWEIFVDFVRRIVDADVHSLTVSLAGTFRPTDDMFAAARRADELNARIIERAQADGLREDFAVEDLSLVLEQLAAIKFGGEERRRELRGRYLQIQLDGLRRPNGTRLPGAPPRADDLSARWIPRMR